MRKYSYEITRHSSAEINELVVFCSERGECALGDVPHGHVERLQAILNERGAQGWELVQLAFGADGMVGFWKKETN